MVLQAFVNGNMPPRSLRAVLSNSIARLVPHPEVLNISQVKSLNLLSQNNVFLLGRVGEKAEKQAQKALQEAVGGGEAAGRGNGWEAEQHKDFHNTGIQDLPPTLPLTPLFEFSMHPPMAS